MIICTPKLSMINFIHRYLIAAKNKSSKWHMDWCLCYLSINVQRDLLHILHRLCDHPTMKTKHITDTPIHVCSQAIPKKHTYMDACLYTYSHGAHKYTCRCLYSQKAKETSILIHMYKQMAVNLTKGNKNSLFITYPCLIISENHGSELENYSN